MHAITSQILEYLVLSLLSSTSNTNNATISNIPVFSLKRGSVAPHHAILVGNTPTFLPRFAHTQILRRTLPREEMASALIGRKRRLSQHAGAGNKHNNGYNPDSAF